MTDVRTVLWSGSSWNAAAIAGRAEHDTKTRAVNGRATRRNSYIDFTCVFTNRSGNKMEVEGIIGDEKPRNIHEFLVMSDDTLLAIVKIYDLQVFEPYTPTFLGAPHPNPISIPTHPPADGKMRLEELAHDIETIKANRPVFLEALAQYLNIPPDFVNFV